MSFLFETAGSIARGIYGAVKAVTRPRHKVVILSRQSDVPSRDLVALAEALRAADPSLEVVVCCRMIGDTWLSRIADVASMLGQMYHLATAQACVVDGYVIPVSLLDHREGLFVVQMWHALGAIKKFGCQTVGKSGGHSAELATVMRMHRNYDLICCGGPGSVDAFAEAFGADPAKVEPLGLPRMDLLRAAARALADGMPGAETAALVASEPLLTAPGRRVVLYAPTFRRGGRAPYDEVARRFAGDRYVLVVRPHPLERGWVDGANVVNAADADIVDLLPLCSVLITDYSAVAFEAAVIGTPVYFFVPDHDAYRRDVGLNMDPLVEFSEVSSRELEVIARDIDTGIAHPDAVRRLAERYASASPGCAERIAARIMDVIRDDAATVRSS